MLKSIKPKAPGISVIREQGSLDTPTPKFQGGAKTETEGERLNREAHEKSAEQARLETIRDNMHTAQKSALWNLPGSISPVGAEDLIISKTLPYVAKGYRYLKPFAKNVTNKIDDIFKASKQVPIHRPGRHNPETFTRKQSVNLQRQFDVEPTSSEIERARTRAAIRIEAAEDELDTMRSMTPEDIAASGMSEQEIAAAYARLNRELEHFRQPAEDIVRHDNRAAILRDTDHKERSNPVRKALETVKRTVKDPKRNIILPIRKEIMMGRTNPKAVFYRMQDRAPLDRWRNSITEANPRTALAKANKLFRDIPAGGQFRETSLSSDSYPLLTALARKNRNGWNIIPDNSFNALNDLGNKETGLIFKLGETKGAEEVLDIVTKATKKLIADTGQKIPLPKMINNRVHVPNLIMQRKGTSIGKEAQRNKKVITGAAVGINGATAYNVVKSVLGKDTPQPTTSGSIRPDLPEYIKNN